MKALSIRQPWAWLILHGGKDIENRTWYSHHRGRFAIHAGKSIDKEAYNYLLGLGVVLPKLEDLPVGGFVGTVDMIDCVQWHSSRWYIEGCWAFVLKDPQPMSFVPAKGQLNFFRSPFVESKFKKPSLTVVISNTHYEFERWVNEKINSKIIGPWTRRSGELETLSVRYRLIRSANDLRGLLFDDVIYLDSAKNISDFDEVRLEIVHRLTNNQLQKTPKLDKLCTR